jgi:hypothetical protein
MYPIPISTDHLLTEAEKENLYLKLIEQLIKFLTGSSDTDVHDIIVLKLIFLHIIGHHFRCIHQRALIPFQVLHIDDTFVGNAAAVQDGKQNGDK